MLELRLIADAKRVTGMRDAIIRECRRANVGPEHSETVAFVAEQLVGDDGAARRGRRARRLSEVFVIVRVQSDATMLMVRVARPEHAEFGERRQQLLQIHASRWSTMSGRDGRTIWAEITRTSVSADPVTRAVRIGRPGHARVEALSALAPSD